MNRSYAYSPYLWPILISAVLVAALGWYSWRRRNVPGALPFSVTAVFGVLWITGLLLENAATEPSLKIFWFKFQGVWQLPLATAITCFVVQYAGLGRWLTRRNLLLLSILPLLVAALILTNGLHHSMWQGFQVGQTVNPVRGSAYWAGFGYACTLAIINVVIFTWLFIRSPRYRWPVGLMLIGQVGSRTFYTLDTLKIAFPEPLSPIVFMFVFMFAIYAVALFLFRVFDPVPLAGVAVLEQMTEGMLVLDLQGRVVDLNHTAAKILGKPTTELRGRAVSEVLPANPDITTQQDKTAIIRSEISMEADNAVRYYNLNMTPLTDRRGELFGQLLLLHDITAQKQAQEQVFEQQRMVATLQERERLARELHDGIGQVLGYIGIQAQAVRKWIHDGDVEKADSLLGRLVEVAKDAHADVRESILSLRTGQVQNWSFIRGLKQYLDSFQANYAVRTELTLSDRIGEKTFGPDAGVQLLRIIQEALTNARKHGGARMVKISIKQDGSQTHIAITDDGCGFDTSRFDRDNDSHFGLAFMRERMAQINGSMEIDSRPGAGTVVRLNVPTRDRLEETE